MGQPKFFFESKKDWLVAKQAAKNRYDELEDRPHTQEQIGRYIAWLDENEPTWLEKKK